MMYKNVYINPLQCLLPNGKNEELEGGVTHSEESIICPLPHELGEVMVCSCNSGSFTTLTMVVFYLLCLQKLLTNIVHREHTLAILMSDVNII